MSQATRRSVVLACAMVVSCGVAAAAGPTDSTKTASTATLATASPGNGWEYLVVPYLFVPSMSGRVGVGDLVADIEVDAGDIVGALDFGGMLYLEMHDAAWAVSLDAGYMDLGAGGSTRLGDVSVDVKQLGVTVAGYRRVAPWAEAMVALQFNRLEGAFEGTGPLALDLGNERSWVDPLVGVRLAVPDSTPWRIAFTGSVGGFGIGSQLAWQVLPEVGYRFNPTFELSGAWRALGIDYEEGDGSGKFVYDLVTAGPQLSFRFHF